jgi:uncharacterized membrane protein YhiD involved in acid resistance
VLGGVATAIGCAALWGLKWIETVMVVAHDATLTLSVEKTGPSEVDVRQRLRQHAFDLREVGVVIREGSSEGSGEGSRQYTFSVRELRSPKQANVAAIADELARLPGVRSVHWRNRDAG